MSARAAVLVLALAGLALAREGARLVTTTVVQDASVLAFELGSVRRDEAHLVLAPGASQGTAAGPWFEAAPFDRLVASVNAETPGDSTVELLVRVRLASGATDWLSLGWVGSASPAARIPRSAPPLPKGSPVKVAIDTVELGERASSAQALVVLRRARTGESPRVRRVTLCAWPRGVRDQAEPERRAWGAVLAVPARSQRVEDPKVAGRICSPTSLSMVLAFHGIALPTSSVYTQVHDEQARIYGNWALNVAFAGRLGLDAAVVRMGSFRPLEEEILAGRPVVISHRWEPGELEGAPIASSDGHLVVVTGFTPEGDVRVNDPCADPRRGQAISRVYRRRDLEKTWLGGSDGIAYVVRRDR